MLLRSGDPLAAPRYNAALIEISGPLPRRVEEGRAVSQPTRIAFGDFSKRPVSGDMVLVASTADSVDKDFMQSTKLRACFAALISFVVIDLVACTRTTLTAADYDQSCASDGDCTTVIVGDVCDCSAESAAISKRAEAKYFRDRAELSKCDGICDPPGYDPPARCDRGHCVMTPWGQPARR